MTGSVVLGSQIIGRTLESITWSSLRKAVREGCGLCKQEVSRALIYRTKDGLIAGISPDKPVSDSNAYSVNLSVSNFAYHVSSCAVEGVASSISEMITDYATLWVTGSADGPVLIYPSPKRQYCRIFMDWLTESIPDVRVIHLIGGRSGEIVLTGELPDESSMSLCWYASRYKRGMIPVHVGDLNDVTRLEMMFEPRRAVGAVPLISIGRWIKGMSIECGERRCYHGAHSYERELVWFGSDYLAMVTAFLGFTDLDMSEFGVVIDLWRRAHLRYIRPYWYMHHQPHVSSPLLVSAISIFGPRFYDELEAKLRELVRSKYGTDDYRSVFGVDSNWDKRRKEILSSVKRSGVGGTALCK